MPLKNTVFAVVGAKGGVGKTTTSVNIGASLADAGYSAVTVEFDLAMANLVDFVDVHIDINDSTTLHDVLAGNADIEEACYDAKEGFSLALSGIDLDGFTATDMANLPDMIEKLRWLYDVIILDTPAGVSNTTIQPLQLADAAILVSTPRIASVRNAQNTLEIAKRVDTDVCGMVITKSGTGASPGADRIADFLELELLGHVPEDDAIPHSQDNGVPVVDYAPNSGAAIAYRKIAMNVVGPEIEEGKAPEQEATASEDLIDAEEIQLDDIRPEPVVKPWSSKFPWEVEDGHADADEESNDKGLLESESSEASETEGDLGWRTVESYFPDEDELAPDEDEPDVDESSDEAVEQGSEDPGTEPVERSHLEDQTGQVGGEGDTDGTVGHTEDIDNYEHNDHSAPATSPEVTESAETENATQTTRVPAPSIEVSKSDAEAEGTPPGWEGNNDRIHPSDAGSGREASPSADESTAYEPVSTDDDTADRDVGEQGIEQKPDSKTPETGGRTLDSSIDGDDGTGQPGSTSGKLEGNGEAEPGDSAVASEQESEEESEEESGDEAGEEAGSSSIRGRIRGIFRR